VLDTALNIDWDRAQPIFRLEANDTSSPSPEPIARTTIDNLWFGGSAALPAANVAPTVLDFPISTFSSYRAVLPGSPAAFKIDVTVDPAQATLAALHFTFHNIDGASGNIWTWANSLCVRRPGGPSVGEVVNLYGNRGVRSIACQTPSDAAFAAPDEAVVRNSFGLPDDGPSSWIVRLDPSWLARGVNTIILDLLAPVVIGDMHIELTYPPPIAPGYVQQRHWLLPHLNLANPEPTVAWIGTGPGTRVTTLAGLELWRSSAPAFTTGVKSGSTMMRVNFEAWNEFAGWVSGAAFSTRGIAGSQLIVNGRVAATFSFPGMGVGYAWVRSDVDLSSVLDWSTVSGEQQIRVEVRALDSDGNAGFPLYDGISSFTTPGSWRDRSLPLLATAELGSPTVVGGVRMFPSATAPAIAVPSNVAVIEDDRVATLSWDGPGTTSFIDYGRRFWSGGVTGYVVSYYPMLNPAAVTKMVTPNRAIQLQPLMPGVVYGAVVQTVSRDVEGKLSAPSVEVQFQSNSARVDGLRALCNGFFDDFNLGGS
jgi:hypothetical protein